MMNDTPTSEPISRSNTHQARDAISSRHSLPSRTKNGFNTERAQRAEQSLVSACSAVSAFAVLRERKEDLFQIVCGARCAASRREARELRQCALAADAAAAQQHESIADASRVANLMN